MTDGRGIPLGLAVAGANVNDHLLPAQTLAAILVERPSPNATGERPLCLDKGYDDEAVDTLIDAHRFAAHRHRRGEDREARPRDLERQARHWAVERAHSWLNRFCRLFVRWEKRADTYTARLHIACAVIAWEQSRPTG